MAFMMKTLLFFSTLAFSVDAYWLMGAENVLVTQRLDPIMSPGLVSGHVHTIFGGSNFGSLSTAELRKSQCTSVPIAEDHSNYWVPQLYFQHKDGSFTDVHGGAVFYYLFSNPAGNITAFPDDFRMITGTPSLRSYNPSSYAQRAVTFLCLDFNGVSTRHNELPAQQCPSGIRAQLNFPSCWDGKNVDSPDHKSHVAFRSGGPDQGSCTDPNYPVELPRIFMEVYWSTGDFSALTSTAMNQSQPFVFASGDSTGYGYHGDFVNGWDSGVLQRAIDNCHCNIYGDPTCCAQQNIFTLKPGGQQCFITPTVDEQVSGTLSKLPGNNPVVGFGPNAPYLVASSTPAILGPVYAYTGAAPAQTPTIIKPAVGSPASPTPQVNIPSGKPGASSSPVISPAKGTPSPSPSMPSPPPPYVAPSKGQTTSSQSSPSNAMVPQPSASLSKPSSPPASNTPYPSPSGCESTKVVTVTVTVTVNHQVHKARSLATPTPHHIPTASPTEHCDEETPSPASSHSISHHIPSASPTHDHCDEEIPTSHSTPHHIPTASPTHDDCDKETPSPTHHHASSTPKMKASRPARARHNAGRRFLHNNGHSF